MSEVAISSQYQPTGKELGQILNPPRGGSGVPVGTQEGFAIAPEVLNNRTLRVMERLSIRAFVQQHCGYLTGRVLDYGAGKPGTCLVPEPYRDLVAGEYIPFDIGGVLPDKGTIDAILCTQMLQYSEFPQDDIRFTFTKLLKDGGHLVMTYPTHWPECESTDLWRFTKSGVEHMLKVGGFKVLAHERRAEIGLDGLALALGYGVVAQKI